MTQLNEHTENSEGRIMFPYSSTSLLVTNLLFIRKGVHVTVLKEQK